MTALPHRQGVRAHPQRHHDREVEGRDGRHDSDGLAQRVHVDAVGDLAGEAALEVLGQPAGVLDVLEPRAISPCASARVLPCSFVISGPARRRVGREADER